MANVSTFEFVLEPSGDPDSAHSPHGNTMGQAPIIRNAAPQSRNTVEGYLKTVIHGRAGGEGKQIRPATLIVIHFRFLSLPGSQNFHRATIKFVPEDQEAFYINRIAPIGNIALYPDEDWNIGSFRGHGFAPSDWMDPNSAEWSMEENAVQESGIPPELTVAMIIERFDDEPFVIEVGVSTMVGRGSDSSNALNKIPIRFDPRGEAIGLDTLPPGTDINDLPKVNIGNFCQIGPVDSIETLRAREYCQ